MRKALQRNSHLVAILIALVLLIGFGSWRVALASPSTIAIQTQATATTSVTYLTPGTATTTYQFDNSNPASGKVFSMQGIDSGSMLLSMTASSSGNLSTIAWQFQFSNNGIDWYGENASANAFTVASSSISEATTSITHLWTPGLTTTTTRAFAVPITPAQHERVVFFIPGNPQTSASSSAIYFELDLKKNPSTP